MVTNSVIPLWDRIRASLEGRVPKECLATHGASEREICKAEKALGQRLPGDIREFYSISNGLPDLEIVPDVNIGFCLPLVPLKKRSITLGKRTVVEIWTYFHEMPPDIIKEEWIQPKGPITRIAWTPDWIPIFDNTQGDYLMLDMKPPKRGTQGQLIDWYGSYGPKRVFARSFHAFLDRLASDLERNRYRVEPGNFSVTLTKLSVWKKRQAHEQGR